MTDDFTEALDRWLSARLDTVHTCIPAVIESYEGHATRRASVKPMIHLKTQAGVDVEMPIIKNVPVMFPSSEFFSLLYPLKKGDGCLLMFSESSIGKFLDSDMSNAVNANDRTRHSLTDAICLTGLWSWNSVPSLDQNDDDIQIIYKKNSITMKDDVITLKNKSGAELILNGTNIELNGDSKKFVTYAELNTALQTLVSSIQSQYNTHVHVESGASTAPPTIPISLSLDISTAETQTIKTGG